MLSNISEGISCGEGRAASREEDSGALLGGGSGGEAADAADTLHLGCRERILGGRVRAPGPLESLAGLVEVGDGSGQCRWRRANPGKKKKLKTKNMNTHRARMQSSRNSLRLEVQQMAPCFKAA
eukprot:s7606_g2.t1